MTKEWITRNRKRDFRHRLRSGGIILCAVAFIGVPNGPAWLQTILAGGILIFALWNLLDSFPPSGSV